ncbi:phosphoribosylamine--glycine ligase [Patescibacteria group bacterium]|nr:phosphoribosylamine--glycine ligase [Patescibacteria group bacterium]
MKKILLIGNGAREHAIALSLKKSPQKIELATFAASVNPGIKELSSEYQVGELKNNTQIASFATEQKVDWAIVGPEAPLAQGIVDVLSQVNIPAIGPAKKLAQIETSKSFTRELMNEYKIAGLPEFTAFESIEGIEDWLQHLEESFVIKPDGLTGGKGVKVSGDHFKNMNEGMAIINELLNDGQKIVIEEKLIGQEFTLMSLADGQHLVHLPAAQDHKRALADDKGPNTGGMGSYSCADFSLPFLEPEDINMAQEINESTALALKNKFGIGYKGVLYGGFIVTKNGVKLIEYNARFGDPEAMNIFSLLKSDFVEICEAIINGNLDKVKVEFENLASVCKYAVPEGYPDEPVKDQKINVSRVNKNKVDIYYAAVDQKQDGLYLTGSRAIALVGKHQDLYQAEKIVEEEIKKIKGPVVHREDIGTKELIEKRVKVMEEVRS